MSTSDDATSASDCSTNRVYMLMHALIAPQDVICRPYYTLTHCIAPHSLVPVQCCNPGDPCYYSYNTLYMLELK